VPRPVRREHRSSAFSLIADTRLGGRAANPCIPPHIATAWPNCLPVNPVLRSWREEKRMTAKLSESETISIHGEMIARLAELEIDPAQLHSYKALLAEEIEASVKSEQGVLMLHAVSIKGRPSQIRIFEVYADQEAYQAHLVSPHFLKYKTLTSSMVRSLRLVETDPIMLCAKDGLSNI
jgi:quinol monooxygenase YgiN